MREYFRTVLYYETDQMSIVHHSNYIRWFEEARMDYMKQSGVDYRDVERDGVLMPVVRVDCRYRRSALYGDPIRIETRLTDFNGVRVRYAYRVLHAETGLLLAEGGSEHCFIDAATRAPLNLKRVRPDWSALLCSLAEQEKTEETL